MLLTWCLHLSIFWTCGLSSAWLASCTPPAQEGGPRTPETPHLCRMQTFFAERTPLVLSLIDHCQTRAEISEKMKVCNSVLFRCAGFCMSCSCDTHDSERNYSSSFFLSCLSNCVCRFREWLVRLPYQLSKQPSGTRTVLLVLKTTRQILTQTLFVLQLSTVVKNLKRKQSKKFWSYFVALGLLSYVIT